MQHFFHKLRRFVLDSIFPAYCLGCKREGDFLCTDCRKALPRLQKQVCPWCYKPAEFGKTCPACANNDRFLDGVIAAGKFEEKSLLQKAIHQLKYDFVEEIAQPLGEILFDSAQDLVKKNPQKKFALCPLPLHIKRHKWRGFNQAELLSNTVILRLHQEGHWNAETGQFLKRVHFLKPQMELKREERMKNMMKAFEAQGPLERSDEAAIVVIDDIATTLSTLNSAARALKKAGWKEVYGLVLARVF